VRGAFVALALALLALVARPVRAVEPGVQHARLPESLGLSAEDVTFPAADSAAVRGWWLAGPAKAPVLVLAGHGTGTMADLLPAAQQFLARGFAVLMFDYRGFGPGNGPEAADTLRYVVFDSKWVDDMAGALRYARKRGGAHVFAWGQDLGSAVVLAAAARQRGTCDGIAIEGLFRTSQEQLAANGTGMMNDVVVKHRLRVSGSDEPFSAMARLTAPAFVVIAGKDEVTPAADTRAVLARGKTRRDVWLVPEGGHLGLEGTPGYYDRVAQWLRQWLVLPPGKG
jgi:alpha-beta hydrolase superfamily lysophospholipase